MSKQPATPLPWRADDKQDGGRYAWATKPNAEYIVAAANAYPRLVEALRKAHKALDTEYRAAVNASRGGPKIRKPDALVESTDLLREIGEL